MMMGRSVIAPFVLIYCVVDNIYDGKEYIVDFCYVIHVLILLLLLMSSKHNNFKK